MPPCPGSHFLMLLTALTVVMMGYLLCDAYDAPSLAAEKSSKSRPRMHYLLSLFLEHDRQ